MDYTPDVIYFKDKSGKLILVNRAFAKGMNCQPKDVVGKTDYDIFPRKRAERMAKDDASVLKSGKTIIDKVERATRPDGVDNYVSTTKIPRQDAKGSIIGLIGITRDITRRIYLERLASEKGNLEKKARDWEELYKAKSQFVSVVSHEMRTPLAIIKESMSLIAEGIFGPLNERQNDLIKKAGVNAQRLNNIVNDLLDISRIERGTFRLHFSLVNLNDLINDTAGHFRSLARQKGIALDYALPDQEINLFIDLARINQVLANLISNAVKFTETGGKIKVEVRILESKIRVGVIDTGIGISADNLPKLFNKFVQVSGLESHNKAGLGLGLSISRELVERHGGEIWAESRLGIGSKFYFTLPRFYTKDVLPEQVRRQINLLIENGVKVHLINLTIFNYTDYRQMIKIGLKKLFKSLKKVIDQALANKFKQGQSKIILVDEKTGNYDIIISGIEEEIAEEFCDELKSRIKKFFVADKIEDIFINLGVLYYPKKIELRLMQEVSANVNITRILIGSEMRRHKRVQWRANIEINPGQRQPLFSQAIDVSQGGICFICDCKLKTDSLIDLRIDLSKGSAFNLKARIAWLSGLKGGEAGKYKIGAGFYGLKTKEKKLISKFIDSLSDAAQPAK